MAMFASLRHRLHDPIMWSSASQLLKTAFATVIAWVLAGQVFGLEQAYLAPWAALLTVHATVFGSLRRGVRQAGASVLGVLVAFAAGQLFGLSAVSVGAAILVGLLVGSVGRLRDETTTTAATALIVLTNGYSDNGGVLGARLLDTGVGIAVGLLVNLLVWPPLRDRNAASQIDAVVGAVGRVLSGIAARLSGECGPAEVDDWIAKTNALDRAIDRAWSVLAEARESGRLNPRRATARRMRAAKGFDDLLGRLGQAVAETRSMARTIGHARVPAGEWDRDFRERWRELLDRAGGAISAGDAEAVASVRADLTAYVNELAVGHLGEGFWPVAGAVLVNLGNILDALDVVADAQPVEVPRPTLRPAVRHPPEWPTALGVAAVPDQLRHAGRAPEQPRRQPVRPHR
jgi:Aromatic acid exporter family member 1